MSRAKPCPVGGCGRPKKRGKQRCEWHWLAKQPPDVQGKAAQARLLAYDGEHRSRVPASEWPEGHRWCAGCQSFVPMFYTSGSRCKACASSAAHASRVQSTYGISGDEYQALLEAQGGRCFICQRLPRTKRLAVDHDHITGEVRGLLCANNEMGCNRAIVGNLEAAPGGGVAAARRTILYLTLTPWQRLTNGGNLSWEQFCRDELVRIEHERIQRGERAFTQVGLKPPPF